MHNLQLTQFDGHSAHFQASINRMTIKLNQVNIVHNTDEWNLVEHTYLELLS